MRTLLSCAAAILLATSAGTADELDREAKGKPAPPVSVPAVTPAGSELDRESPDQSCRRCRRGWGGGYSYYSTSYYYPAPISYYPAVSYTSYYPAVSYSTVTYPAYPSVTFSSYPSYYGVTYSGW